MELIGGQKKVVLITSGQPSLNPRLVKEADALAATGYSVTVLYAYWNGWGTEIDRDLLLSKKWKAICVGGNPVNQRVIYFLSRLIHKVSLLATRKTRSKLLADFAIARSSFLLIREAPRHKADLYIGHNLGALPASVNAARKNNAKSGFDAEDFHRFELDNNIQAFQHQLAIYLEDKYIPQVDYLTTSSPGISSAYRALYQHKSPVTVLNVFPAAFQIPAIVRKANDVVKLFWFSQTISHGRGLKECIGALKLINNPLIELHLLGFVTESDKRQLTDFADKQVNMVFYPPIPPDQIIQLAATFDIGLAPEENAPYNRQLCLTNKIFTYMQAGLAIIASDTAAQTALLKQYHGTGLVYQCGNSRSLADQMMFYWDHRQALLEAKKASFSIARKELNWETESKKFLKVISDILRD